MKGRLLVPMRLSSARPTLLVVPSTQLYSTLLPNNRQNRHTQTWHHPFREKRQVRRMINTASGGNGAPAGFNETSLLHDIQLNKIEDALCVLLDDACRWIETTQPQPDNTESGGVQVDYKAGWKLEARIAGGWVRDKLLGYESHDLDISLSSLTGHIFALLLRTYLLSSEFAASELATAIDSPFHESSSSSDNLVGHITRIAANPEQSKNLETATAKVAGLQLDFVNLRKEVYIGTSRIPTMTFGTAQEDAERRDITINTLFFNIHTRKVEDYTGMGLADLKNKIIRTPLSPQRTFLDDPLRVLRCVRFASRFGYTIDRDIVRCFEGKDGKTILEALGSKVSRDRFGKEVDNMLRGPDPYRAMSLINDLHLFNVIFTPLSESNLRGDPSASNAMALDAARLLNSLWEEARLRKEGKTTEKETGIEGIPSEFLDPLLNEESRRVLFYSAALLPLKGIEWEEKKKKWAWAGDCVILFSLKLGVNNTKKPVSEMAKAVEILQQPVSEVFNASDALYRGNLIPSLADSPLSPRATMALLIRQPCITTPDVGLNLYLCLLWTMVQDVATSKKEAHEFASLCRPYIDFYKELKTYGLLDRIHEKPLLDGKQVQEALKIKPGKNLQTILKRVEAWQFDHDIIVEEREQAQEDCKGWLVEEWAKGGIIPLKRRAT